MITIKDIRGRSSSPHYKDKTYMPKPTRPTSLALKRVWAEIKEEAHSQEEGEVEVYPGAGYVLYRDPARYNAAFKSWEDDYSEESMP